MRVAPEITLTSEEQAELTRLSDSAVSNPRLAQRARIVLLAAQGIQNKDIAEQLAVGRVQVARWRERYMRSRLAGIAHDLPRGAPAAKVDVEGLVRMTTQSTPASAPRWSTRTMAAAMGISPASVSRHWRTNALTPQAAGGFDLRRDVGPSGNIEGIVGLYLSPSIRAMAFGCRAALVGEALVDADHTRAPGVQPPDMTALFAAISALEGQGFSTEAATSPHAPWLKFLQRLDHETPSDLSLHVLIDGPAVRRHPSVTKWLGLHARFHVHSTPASATWLASIGQLLGDIDQNQLRSHAFASAPQLVAAISGQVARPGPHPDPFIWTGSARTWRAEEAPTAGGAGIPYDKHASAPALLPARTKAKARAMTRLSGDGDSLRDNVINLKRDRILQEAAKLFFERGYLQTSVDAIAERLGATKPFVYYHFHSKVDILVEICEKSNRDVLAAAESAMSTIGSPRVRFEQFLREFTHVALQQRQLVAIYFREEISLPPDASERIKQMRNSINLRLTALLNEGINTGDFQIEDPRMGALVIAGMSSYAFAWYRENGRLDQQEVTNRIVKMALKLVSASPFQRPAYRIHSVART
jgi:AcrR family transcriptional regulator